MKTWIDVCAFEDLQPDSGVCALVAGKQVALFYMTRSRAVYAVGNYDPFGKANVLSRGMIGDVRGEPMVASPLYKHHFSLNTGTCLENGDLQIATYPVRVENGRVSVAIEAE